MRVLDPARHAGSALLSAQSDERLVELVRTGHERAFEAIVNRYQRPLLRHCARVLPAARAEDAVQQTFLKAHTAIRDGDADLNLRPWLYRIARNTALNVLRATLAAVQRLPGRQRDAIVLRELEGRTYDEIASALTVSDGAVRQLLSRARSSLRAGVSALTPSGLLLRLAGRDPSLVDGATAAAGGAGTLVGLAKLSAGVLIGGAAAVGGGVAVLHGSSPHPTPARAAVPAAASSFEPSASTHAAGAPSGAPIGRGLASTVAVSRPATSGGAGTHGFAITDGGGAFASRGDGSGQSGDGGQRSDGGRSGGDSASGVSSRDGGGGSTSGDGGSGGGSSSTADGGGGSTTADGGGSSTADGGGSSGDGQQVTVGSPSGSTSGDGSSTDGGGSGSHDQVGQTTIDGH